MWSRDSRRPDSGSSGPSSTNPLPLAGEGRLAHKRERGEGLFKFAGHTLTLPPLRGSLPLPQAGEGLVGDPFLDTRGHSVDFGAPELFSLVFTSRINGGVTI